MAVHSMARGEPLDVQRETRWPNQTTAAIEVAWKPWQDGSDFSDTEGIFDSSGSYNPSQTLKMLLGARSSKATKGYENEEEEESCSNL